MGYKGPLSFYGNVKEGYITLDKWEEERNNLNWK